MRHPTNRVERQKRPRDGLEDRIEVSLASTDLILGSSVVVDIRCCVEPPLDSPGLVLHHEKPSLVPAVISSGGLESIFEIGRLARPESSRPRGPVSFDVVWMESGSQPRGRQGSTLGQTKRVEVRAVAVVESPARKRRPEHLGYCSGQTVEVFLGRPESVRGPGGIVKLPQLLLASSQRGTDGFGPCSLGPHTTKRPADDRSGSEVHASPDQTGWGQIVE
jgi:hypothetical protein